MTVGTVFSPRLQPANKACIAAKTLLARVALDAPANDPFELLVGTRPKITDFASLPPAITVEQMRAAEDEPFEPNGTISSVVGGASFTDAPQLEPGRYSDSLRAGEQLIYKIPVTWGQRPRIRVTLETDTQSARELSRPGILAEVTMVSPTLRSLGRTGPNGGNFWKGDRPVTLTGEGVELRARNIEASGPIARSASLAGDQYAVVSMAEPLGRDASQFAAPLTISVDVAGDEAGVPKFAGKVNGPDSEVTAKKGDGGGFPWAAISIGAAVFAVIAAAYGLGRRNRTSG
jgi:Ca-activated chloride channel family protein